MNKEKLKQYNHEYYLKNRDTLLIRNRIYYFNNKAKCNEYARNYYYKKIKTLKGDEEYKKWVHTKKDTKRKKQKKYKVIDDDTFIINFT